MRQERAEKDSDVIPGPCRRLAVLCGAAGADRGRLLPHWIEPCRRHDRVLYSIPKVTLYPLVLLVFGPGLSAQVAFGVMHGLAPIAIFTMNAMR